MAKKSKDANAEKDTVDEKPKKKRSLTRRVFMLGSMAIAGGVVFGAYHYKKPLKNPLQDSENEITLNPYLFITAAGIKVIAPRAEMGQGVHTTLAAMVAEELDVAWDDVEVIHGPASATYYNAEVLKLGLPFADYSQSTVKDVVSGTTDIASKILGQQITGGSTTTRDGFMKMRQAGAAARLAIIEAAAYEFDVPANELKTSNGEVIAPNGSRIKYQDLAFEASAIKVEQDPPLKDPSEWRYLGKAMPRKDMVGKVTGTAEFGIDVKQDDMLFATVRVNPKLGGKMLSFDGSKAAAMRGVVKIVDLWDGIGVIADNTWTAFQAAEALEIEWGDASYPSDNDGIYAEIEKAFDEEPNSVLRNDGVVDETLAAASDVIEANYRVPYLAHTAMEPMNATALLKDGELDVWVGNQAPTVIQEHVAKAVGLSIEDVRVHTPYLGGGFGRKPEYDSAVQAAKLAKAMPERAVKMTWTREEDVRHDFYRPASLARMKGLVSEDGPSALKLDIAAPSVYRSQAKRVLGIAPPGPDKLLVEGAFDQPYGIPDFQVNGYLSKVEVPVGSWRSVGNSYNSFFLESFLDELAVAKRLDPLAMRLNLMKDLDKPSFDTLRAVGDIAGWGAPTGAGRGRGAGFGRGVAFCYSFGSPTAQIIDVSQTDDGVKIDKVWCAIDVGTALDPSIIEAQVTSAILYGLSAAIYGDITFEDGEVVEGNFDEYDALRMGNAPPVEVKILQSTGHIGGVGEPGVPPSMPALANAVYDLLGKRERVLPLGKSVDFVTV